MPSVPITLLNKIKLAETDTVRLPIKPKRVMSEETKEKLKVAREAAKARKMAEKESEESLKKEAEENLERKEREKAEKKAAANEKRKANALKRKENSVSTVDDDVDAPKKKKSVDQKEPPEWFTHFITNTLDERIEELGVKASRKEIKEQGKEQAREKWQDEPTRRKVRQAVDEHRTNMYSSIFH